MSKYFEKNLDKYLTFEGIHKDELDDLAVAVYEQSTQRPILSSKEKNRRKVSSRRRSEAMKVKSRISMVKSYVGGEPAEVRKVKAHQLPLGDWCIPSLWNESTSNHRRTLAAEQQLRDYKEFGE